MLRLIAFLAFGAAAAVSGFYDQTILAAVLGVASAVSFFLLLQAQNAQDKRNSEETTQTDAQLRAEVIAVQKLAFAKLAGASDEFKTTVAEKIADAAQHLGYPHVNSRRVYASDHTLNWNKEGLRKIAEARKWVEGYMPPAGK